MSKEDWRRYHFAVYPDGSVSRGYLDKDRLWDMETYFGAWPEDIIGIINVKGKTPQVQQKLWKRSI